MTHHLPITPMGKPRMTQRDRWANRPVIVRYFKYSDDLRKYLKNYTPPAELTITFYLPMPASWSKKKRLEMDGKPHQQTPDCDNLIKGFTDSYCTKRNPGAIADDSYIYKITAAKYWSLQGGIDVED